VTTHFAKASVVMNRVDERRFMLVVRRSFSDYVWRWIEDATDEFGLVIKLS
jgi:sarcosine oxidase subunit gamma